MILAKWSNLKYLYSIYLVVIDLQNKEIQTQMRGMDESRSKARD